MAERPIALTIAGSDSGGGAGIQADLKTFHAFGVFGTSAITAVTAQNTVGVRAVHAVPAEIVRAQIEAVAEDLPPAGIKTGMLATLELVGVVAETIAALDLGENYVLDPVMVASSGDRLLEREAERAISGRLLPLARIVTPNLDECAILVGNPVRTVDDMEAAAGALVAQGARAALVKGGHLEGHTVADVLHDGRETTIYRRPRLLARGSHGTGCTLSAAIAAGLALDRPLKRAVEDGLEFVARGLASAPGLGAGSGPLDHFVEAPAT